MLEEGFIHSSIPSNLSKASNLSQSKAQDFDIISLQLTQSSKCMKKENLLHEAVIKNDINKVNSLLEANVPVNSKIHLDRTPLHWAAMHGHLELIDILVTNAADLEVEDKLGMTPLLVAAWYGHVQAVEKLLAWGSNPQVIDKKGETILHCAAKNDHFDVIKFLLNTCLNQLSLDAQDKKLQTALHFAVIESDVDIVNRLIECGASLTIKDKNERTCLHWAAVKGYSDIMDVLLQNKSIDINTRDGDGKSALLLACEFGHKKCAKLLLENGSDIYHTDNEGRTALHIASSLGYTSVCEVILSSNSNSPLKIREKKGNTALHLGVMGNHHNTVQLLIQHGAPLNAMNARQQTALHIACEMGFTESAQVLILHGADFTISEKASGRTALYIAARGSFPAIVDMLIKADRSRQSQSFSMYSELSRKCSLERNISLDSTDTHRTYLTSDSSDIAAISNQQLQHQLSRQQSEYSQYEMDPTSATANSPQANHQHQPQLQRQQTYPTSGKATSHQSINSHSNSFRKQFYNNNTKEMRDILCLVAKHYLEPGDWKKLAKLWQFTDEHIQAIEHQYTGKTSFKEHGFRMMLIWLISFDSLPPNAHQSALKELLDSLRIIGRKDVSERIRKKIADGEFQNHTKTSEGILKNELSNKLSSLMADEVSEGIKLGQSIVRIVASVVGLNRGDHRKRCDCFPTSNGSCSYCSIF